MIHVTGTGSYGLTERPQAHVSHILTGHILTTQFLTPTKGGVENFASKPIAVDGGRGQHGTSFNHFSKGVRNVSSDHPRRVHRPQTS
jgi:hypothetical protein